MKKIQKNFNKISIFLAIIGIILVGISCKSILFNLTNEKGLRYPLISPNYTHHIDKQINEKVSPSSYFLASEIFETLVFLFFGIVLIILSFALKQKKIFDKYLLVLLFFFLILSIFSLSYSIKYKHLTRLRVNEINNFLDSRFSVLKIGMDFKEVLETVGFPIEKKELGSEAIEKWLYITSIDEDKYKSNKSQLIIIFNKGKIEKFEHPISIILF